MKNRNVSPLYIFFHKLKRDFYEFRNRNSPFHIHWFFLSDRLKYLNNEIAIDIGSHGGRFSWSLKKSRHFSQIILFEPQYDLALFSSYYFGFDHVINKALSNYVGETTIKIPIKDENILTTRASLSNPNLLSSNSNIKLKEIEVRTSTLDVELQKINVLNKRISFIKIDAEGEESRILEGSINTINLFNPDILIELEYQRCFDNVITCIDIFLSLDYVLLFDNEPISDKSLIIEKIKSNHSTSPDFLFIKK